MPERQIRVAWLGSARIRPEEITIFESLGIAIEDLAAAGYVLRRARETGAGSEVRF